MLDRLMENVETGREMAESHTGESFGSDNRAQNSASRAISLIVALTVGALVAAFLLPIAIDELGTATLTNASSGATSLWNILDVIIVLAVFLFFTAVALAGAGKI